MADRECVYRLLAQTKPENLHKSLLKYTIDPKSRYPSMEYTIRPEQVIGLVVTDCPHFLDTLDPSVVTGGTMVPASPVLHGASPAKKRKVNEREVGHAV